MESLLFFWMWSLGMMRLTWRSWKRLFAVLRFLVSFGEHVRFNSLSIYGFSIKVLLISNFLMWILIHFVYYSKIGCSWLWDKEAPDHAYHCRWPCICGWPNWGASYRRTLQWVYPKLWHCCLQQNLRNILLVQGSSHFHSAIYFFCR